MEQISEYRQVPAAPAMAALPGDRELWPRDAGEVHNRLLRELNQWSRDNDWPSTLNSWIAEEAVRRAF